MDLHSDDKRESVSFSRKSLVIAIVGITFALIFACYITFYFTKVNYDKSVIVSPLVISSSPPAADLRLPTALQPLSYNLQIKVYLPGYVSFDSSFNLTYEGQVEMEIEVKQAVRKIVLNMKNISLVEEKIEVRMNGEYINIDSIMLHEELEKISFNLGKTLEKNDKIFLKVHFNGKISNSLGGLYQTEYINADGGQKIAAVTQMEPTYARRMVPCFDEPEYKANWTVTVIHPTGTTALSNGFEKESSKLGDDWTISKFETTPKMSSYLLAIIVSEFHFNEMNTTNGVRFRVWSRPEAMNLTKYALEAGVKCLEYYEKYFGIKYPLKKQDMVALPDFAAKAMENWGLITFRESALLYNEKIYSLEGKRVVSSVVAHELAHQWFGNLVTMQWWEDLWLNEGFATMVEYLGADEISNGYMKMRDFFLVNAVNNALEKDSIASSHPLSFKIDKASEVSEAFDGITYAKGGSVLMMISEVMGEENFNKGLKIYLKQHSYGNAKAADLWQALDKAVPDHVKGPDGNRLNITEFANQWTTQIGFPFLIVTRLNSTTVRVDQQRYKRNIAMTEPEKYRYPIYGFKWDVPVWYQDEKDIQNEKMVWLKRDEPLFIHTNNKSNFAFVINNGMRSFFRQNYDEEGWKRIGQQFQEDHEVYNVRTRMAIISDAYAMALIGELNYGTLLDLVRYIEKEKEYLPWTAMIDGFNVILSYLGTEPESLSIKDYMKTILKQKYDNNSLQYITDHFLDNNTFYDVILETNIMNVFCRMNSPECIHGYTDLFEKEVLQKCGNNKTSDCVMIAGPLRPMTYCYGVQNGDELVYQKMLNFYQRESIQVEKNYLMVSLGCSKNIVTLKSLLTTALDRKAGVFRLQDVPAIFNTVARNDIGKEFMFNFLLDRWDLIYESLKTENSLITAVIKECTKTIKSRHQIEQLKKFRQIRQETTTFNIFDQQIEDAEHTVDWIDKHLTTLVNYFKLN